MDLVPTTTDIVGRPEQVAEALRTQHRMGRLVTHPKQIVPRRLANGLTSVKVTVMAEPPKLSWRKRYTVLAPIAVALAWTAGALLLLAGVATALFFALRSAAEDLHLSGSALLGVAVLVLILVLANRLNHAGACPGYHCDGCRHKR